VRCIWSKCHAFVSQTQNFPLLRKHIGKSEQSNECADSRGRQSLSIGRSAPLYLVGFDGTIRGVRELSWLETPAMQILLGMILGVLITIGAALVYDNSTGRAANGLTVASAEGHAPMVNWDVVSHNWDGMKLQLRDVAVDIEKGWKRITG
jgi:hypothetical protein